MQMQIRNDQHCDFLVVIASSTRLHWAHKLTCRRLVSFLSTVLPVLVMESGTNCIITSVEQTASPKKRSFDTFADSSTSAHSNTVAGPTSPESTNSPANSKPMLPTGASREPSPALSITSSLTSFDTVPPPFGLDGAAQSTLESSQTGPKPKRRKLTPGEKLEREREKAEKERLRTEQKQIKDEERRQKAEEQEEKKRQKEIEKQKREQEREDEKRRLHEERDKKEKVRVSGLV